MIMPTKHIPAEQSLLGAGAVVSELSHPRRKVIRAAPCPEVAVGMPSAVLPVLDARRRPLIPTGERGSKSPSGSGTRRGRPGMTGRPPSRCGGRRSGFAGDEPYPLCEAARVGQYEGQQLIREYQGVPR